MSGPPLGLAKLMRPRLYGAVDRERLFELLDREREHPAICVVGPPGAGKTTLVASYLDHGHVPGIWYQVDAGDADLATFFYYLGQSMGMHGQRGPLPLLTAEYLHDIPGFARRFFRDLFARLPTGSAIVLDNYQEVPADARFHDIVSMAVDELPRGVTLFAISRANPPSHYARLIANQNVALLEWEALKLTVEETRAILTARGTADAALAARLHARSGGWAAALTLLIERGADAGERVDGMDRIFDYFAGEIFSRVDPGVQRFLVATALLPRVTAEMAQALTGNAHAASILESLYQRNLFTHRRPGREPTYQYHALFQEFLLDRGRHLLDEAQRRALGIQAGGLLVATGMPEEAFVLFAGACAFDAAADLLCSCARALIGQGRGGTVYDWAARLPQEHAARPWVRYWLGMAAMPSRPDEARRLIELAWYGFRNADDLPGQTLAASAMIESYYREWHGVRPMDRWIEALEESLARGAAIDSSEVRMRVHASLLLAMLYRRPGHPSIAFHARQATDLMTGNVEADERVVAATFLISYCALAGELALGAEVVNTVEPDLAGVELRIYNRYWWHGRMAFFRYYEGRYEEGIAETDRAVAIAETEGFDVPHTFRHYRLRNLCALGQRVRAAHAVQQIVRLAVGADPLAAWHRAQVRLDLAVLENVTADADQLAREARRHAQDAGMFYLDLHTSMAHAWTLAGRGQLQALEALGSEVTDSVAGTCFAYFEHDVRMCRALCAWNANDRSETLRILREALARARRTGAIFVERWNAPAFAELLAVALEHGIETDYVGKLIRQYAVKPPHREVESWPWPVRLHTLGRFELTCDDMPIEFAGKAPRKVLALLKAIIAFGGHQVPQQQILDALWPQDEADMAQKSLGVAMARLRKMIGRPDALVVSDQRISLDEQLCWVDALALRRLMSAAEQSGQDDTAALLARAERALQLYRGVFLPADTEETWSVQPRNRLRARFSQFIERLAGSLEKASQWHAALDCYQRAMDADDANEAFYRGEMRCYHALGRPADALAVYTRLRQALAATLGVQPSFECEALAKTIAEGRRC